MSYFIRGNDNKKIFVNEWVIKNPKGTIQIVHGMAEHSERYRDFALFLNEKGYNVVATDHRGHGNTRDDDELFGDIGEDGFRLMVEDEILLAKKMKQEYNLPHILLGHSMGSFISQRLVQVDSSSIDALILSGSSCGMELEAKGGELLAKIERSLLGIRPSKLLDKLSFGSYNNKTEKRTAFDWLCRDNKEVDKYIDDKFCGFISPNRMYIYFLGAVKNLWLKGELAKVSKDLPIYIFSGDMDPVGKYGKGVSLLHDLYKLEGIKDLSIKLYEGGRHEMLNEINKVEVYNDVYNWIERVTAK